MGKRHIVCLCGSTRFEAAFETANLEETLKGNIVLSIGCTTTSARDVGVDAATKKKLDELHFDKIRMADEIFILNVAGYIGESTRREMALALSLGKRLRFLETEKGDAYCEENRQELGRMVADFCMGQP
jgi:hypothetical protein